MTYELTIVIRRTRVSLAWLNDTNARNSINPEQRNCPFREFQMTDLALLRAGNPARSPAHGIDVAGYAAEIRGAYF